MDRSFVIFMIALHINLVDLNDARIVIIHFIFIDFQHTIITSLANYLLVIMKKDLEFIILIVKYFLVDCVVVNYVF